MGGHLLETVNPEAAQKLSQEGQPAVTGVVQETLPLPAEQADAPIVDAPVPAPLPRVGEPVRYWARPGEYRGGTLEFPAQVNRVHEDKGVVDLIVFYDAQDLTDQINVPERRNGERGFERVIPAGLAELLARKVLPPMLLAGDHGAEINQTDLRPGGHIQVIPDVDRDRQIEAMADALRPGLENFVTEMIARVMGPYEAPANGYGAVINEHDERIEKLEKPKAGSKQNKAKAAKPKAKSKR